MVLARRRDAAANTRSTDRSPRMLAHWRSNHRARGKCGTRRTLDHIAAACRAMAAIGTFGRDGRWPDALRRLTTTSDAGPGDTSQCDTAYTLASNRAGLYRSGLSATPHIQFLVFHRQRHHVDGPKHLSRPRARDFLRRASGTAARRTLCGATRDYATDRAARGCVRKPPDYDSVAMHRGDRPAVFTTQNIHGSSAARLPCGLPTPGSTWDSTTSS